MPGIFLALFIILFVVLSATIVFKTVFKLRRGLKEYQAIPTFHEYKGRNPELVKDGKASCTECAGTDIYLQKFGSTPGKLLNLHLCRTCGTSLYRSKVQI